jgi:hypothetical protein
MNKKYLILLIFILFDGSLFAQKFTVYGTIKDKSTGEVLTGASIAKNDNSGGVVANNYGFYSLTLPKAKYTFIVSFLGYESISQEIDLTKNEKIDFELVP